jgi:hypothetical protein
LEEDFASGFEDSRFIGGVEGLFSLEILDEDFKNDKLAILSEFENSKLSISSGK